MNCVYVPVRLHDAYHRLFFAGHPAWVAKRLTEIFHHVRSLHDIRVDVAMHGSVGHIKADPPPILRFADWFCKGKEEAWENFANGSPVEDVIGALNIWWVAPGSQLIVR